MNRQGSRSNGANGTRVIGSSNKRERKSSGNGSDHKAGNQSKKRKNSYYGNGNRSGLKPCPEGSNCRYIHEMQHRMEFDHSGTKTASQNSLTSSSTDKSTSFDWKKTTGHRLGTLNVTPVTPTSHVLHSTNNKMKSKPSRTVPNYFKPLNSSKTTNQPTTSESDSSHHYQISTSSKNISKKKQGEVVIIEEDDEKEVVENVIQIID